MWSPNFCFPLESEVGTYIFRWIANNAIIILIYSSILHPCRAVVLSTWNKRLKKYSEESRGIRQMRLKQEKKHRSEAISFQFYFYSLLSELWFIGKVFTWFLDTLCDSFTSGRESFQSKGNKYCRFYISFACHQIYSVCLVQVIGLLLKPTISYGRHSIFNNWFFYMAVFLFTTS